MSKLARRFLIACVVTLAAWLGIVAPSAASVEVCVTPVLASAYIDTLSDASPPYTTTDRGPPVSYDRHTACDSVHLGLRGVVAPSVGLRPVAETIYAGPARLAQVAQVATTTGRQIEVADGDVSALRVGGVAAKSVDNLPTVNWVQQAKHFPGHPNYIPGAEHDVGQPRGAHSACWHRHAGEQGPEG